MSDTEVTEEAVMTPALPDLSMIEIDPGTQAATFMRHGPGPRPKREPAPPKPVTSTVIYDGLASSYNEQPIGGMLIIELPNKPSTGNLHKILLGRGLERDVDYSLFRAVADINGNRFPPTKRPLVLERLTLNELKVPEHRVAMSQKIAKEAKERGAMMVHLTHAGTLEAAGVAIECAIDLPAMPKIPAARAEDLLLPGGGDRLPDPLDEQADQELRSVVLPDLDIGQ